MPDLTSPAEGTAGTLYDLGYQRYDGERLGRGYAVRSLFLHGLGVVFAVGRGLRSRLVPLLLGAVIVLPAVIQSAVAAYSGGALELVRYENYFLSTAVVFALFCAAQAPELVSADLRSKSLVLYLARALRRDDYVLARVGSLAAAVFLLALVPQLVLFAGRVFVAAEPWPALRSELHVLPPILASSTVVALMLATIAVAIASFTERRGIAAGAVIGYFLLAGAFVDLLQGTPGGESGAWLILASPLVVLDGFIHWAFGATPDPRGLVGSLDLPGSVYAAAAAGYVAFWGAVLRIRYRRLGG